MANQPNARQLAVLTRRNIESTMVPPLEAQREESVNISAQPVMTAGQPWSCTIDRVGVITKLEMRVAVTVSTGVTPGTPTARVRNPVETVGTLGFSVNGSQTINVPSDLLFCVAQYMRGTEPLNLDSITSTELAAASTSPAGSVTIPMDLVFPESSPSSTGALATGDSGTLTLSGTNVGGLTTIMDSVGTTTAISAGPTNTVVVTRINPSRISRIGYGCYLEKFNTQTVPTTVTDTQIDIPGGVAFAGLALRAYTGATAAVSDSVFTASTKLQIWANGRLIYDRYVQDVAERTAQRFPPSTLIPRTGFYYLDLLRGKSSDKLNLAKVIPTPAGATLTFRYSATAGTSTAFHYLPTVVAGPVQARVNMNLPVSGIFL